MLKRLYLCDVGGEVTSAGCCVRAGVLYRSSAIHQLNAAEHQRLAALGLRHIIDLREPAVAARWPDALGVEVKTYLPVGMGVLEALKLDDVLRGRLDWRQLTHIDLYAEVLENNADYVRRFLDALLDQPTPALVHCTAGKDRTGILVAIFYLALGIPAERIVATYMAILPHLDQYFPVTLKWLVRACAGPPLAYSVIPEYMEKMLDRVALKYGGVEGYLHSIGFTRLVALRAKFCERNS